MPVAGRNDSAASRARRAGPSGSPRDVPQAGRPAVTTTLGAAALLASGRYAIFHAGVECGEERWSIEAAAEGGAIALGEQALVAPHPLASELSWRARLSPDGRIAALEMEWRVGGRTVRAEHEAFASRWHARILSAGHTREQAGDFPGHAEVAFGSHVLQTVMLRRYALAPGAEHEFPSLVIGPPFFAVEPGRQRIVCTAVATRVTPLGERPARRVEFSDALGPVPAFAAWIDEHDVLLESYEDTYTEEPWMRLVEYRRG